ncbi:MAG: histidine kinase, partial [Bacteroidia bacterium]|nr:histidine kinase [Bacteroidia bacterium]
EETKCSVGALHGLYTYVGQKEISQKDKVLDYRVEGLALCKNKLVIATKDHGLIIKNKKNFDTINTSRGLLSNICRSVKTKQDTIWVNTNLGISEIIYRGSGDYEIINYSLNKLGDFIEINDFEIWGKKIVLRSGSDLCFFSLERKKKEDRVYITAMKVAGQTMNTEKQNLLSHNVSAIRFEYEALFYWNKDKTLFRYRLSNEAGWNYTNETSVSFPGLSSGEFVFMLEAKNSEGRWIKAVQSASFSIQAPFWKTWWFILLEILGVALLTWLLFFIRNKRILQAEKTKNRIKSEMQELQIRVIKAQMNPHFIFNSLNSIQEFILQQDNDNAQKYLSKFAKLIRKLIESNTAESLSLEDEMDILHKYLELESLRFGASFDFEIKKSEHISAALRIPQMMVQPIVENAIWHGLLPKKGERKLKISFSERDKKTIYCRVDDNGIGRNAAAKIEKGPVQHKSLAIDFIKQRLYLLGQAMNVECGIRIVDKEETRTDGTFVEIIIPLINK